MNLLQTSMCNNDVFHYFVRPSSYAQMMQAPDPLDLTQLFSGCAANTRVFIFIAHAGSIDTSTLHSTLLYYLASDRNNSV